LPFAGSCAEARLGARFKVVIANNVANANLRMEVMESPVSARSEGARLTSTLFRTRQTGMGSDFG
jgi:hypothetical protein